MMANVQNKPLITIAVPVYNGMSGINKAIETCLGQSDLTDCEILIVDNASTDGTYDEISKYQRHGALKIIENEETVTMYENHNICLREAAGDYVLFCHADDLLDVDAVAVIKAQLEKRNYPSRYIVWGHSLFRDYSSKLRLHGLRTGQLFAGEHAAVPFLSGGLTPSGTCYSRDILAYGGFIPCSHRLAPSDSSTMVYLALNGFRFEMMQQIVFFRTAASTALAGSNTADTFDAYCDTYSNLRDKIGDDALLNLVRLSNRFRYVPYRFLYFVADISPVSVFRSLARHLIRRPWLLVSRRYWQVTIKAASVALMSH